MKNKLYYLRVLGVFLASGGIGLLIEHLYTWNTLDFTDLMGHEIYGLTLLIIGTLLVAYTSKRGTKSKPNKKLACKNTVKK